MARFSSFFGAALAVASSLLVASVAVAQDAPGPERQLLGVSRVFTNDAIGDGQDRWRTGAFSVSVFRGTAWGGALTSDPLDTIELRFRGEAISPDRLTRPAAGDRLYAGTWWLGAHSHFDWHGFDVAAGVDLAITGEQSGIRSLQASLHDAFSMSRVGLSDYQIDDDVYLHGTLEIARGLRWDRGEMRPFVELQAGAETLARAGVDMTFGPLGQGGLRARDPMTGQRVAGITNIADEGGWSFLLGADTAYVDRSVFLPEDRGYQVEDSRHRLRAGANFGIGQTNLFYGVTWLSEEFVGQPEGQVIGSLSIDIRY